MPELPEVETIRLGLERQISGDSIVRAQLFDFPGVIEPLTLDQFESAVGGRRIETIRRRGKYLLLDLSDDLTIVVHLRMTGSLQITEPDQPQLRFEHLRRHLLSGKQLRFADQRKFGRVQVATPDDLNVLDRKLGIEPLGDVFTAKWLIEALSRTSRPVKSALLDQALIAGIGNIYADEALFRSRIHPMTPSNAISPSQITSLHRNVRLVLRGSIDRGGTTFSSYRNSAGEAGSNQYVLQVYGLGRSASPCPRCGGRLSWIQVDGRSSHYCERCQPSPGESPGPRITLQG